MTEKRELDVVGVSYAGPHCVEPDCYEIVLEVQPAPGAPPMQIALRFHSAEATFLAHMVQSNPPHARVDEDLLDQVAAHDT